MLKIRERGCIRHVSKRAYHQKWKAKGYEIVKDLGAEKKEQELEDKTVDELRDIAKGLDMSGYYNLKKDELIAEIQEVR